jgi:hypothetical protein
MLDYFGQIIRKCLFSFFYMFVHNIVFFSLSSRDEDLQTIAKLGQNEYITDTLYKMNILVHDNNDNNFILLAPI